MPPFHYDCVSISNLTWGNTHLPHPWDRLQGMGALSLIPFQAPFPYPLTYCAQWDLYQWLLARGLWGILPLHQIHSQFAHLSLWRDMIHWAILIHRVAYKGLTPSATWVILEVCWRLTVQVEYILDSPPRVGGCLRHQGGIMGRGWHRWEFTTWQCTWWRPAIVRPIGWRWLNHGEWMFICVNTYWVAHR